MTMAAAASSSTDEKIFDFGFLNHHHHHNNNNDNCGVDFNNGEFFDNDDDGDIAIDIDSFYKILDEELPPELLQQQQQQFQHFPELPINPFYPVTYNTEEWGSTAPVSNDGNLLPPDYYAASENSAETMEAKEQLICASPPEISLAGASEVSSWRNNLGTGSHQSANWTETQGFPSAQDWFGMYRMSSGFSSQNPHDSVKYDMELTNEAERNMMKRNFDDFQSSHSWIEYKPALGAQMGAADISTSEVPMHHFLDGRRPESMNYDNQSAEQIDTVTTYDSSSTTTDEASADPSYWGLMGQSSVKHAVEMKDVEYSELRLLHSLEGKSFSVNEYKPFKGVTSSSSENFLVSESNYSGGRPGLPGDLFHTDRKPTSLPLLDSSATFVNSFFKKEGGKRVARPTEIEPHLLSGNAEECKASLSKGRAYKEAPDDDLYVIEDMSGPAQKNRFSVNGMPMQLSKFSSLSSPLTSPFHQVGVGGTRLKSTDERLIYQAAVKDLAQPRSEATPPDGVLAVPLLRHQRIALSWMVQKETTSLQCSGGILADDQGLGKTVSTIALILTERPQSSSTVKRIEQGLQEMLNLDEEDDNQLKSRVPISTKASSSSSSRGRPSGGTLIVCPTSVLRQWAEELRSKVTSKGNLSVCVYHGNSRTKDPYELSNYDVVLTTYSIVSMEVPKQPVVIKDGCSKRKLQENDLSNSSSRKRKHSSTSDKKQSKREIDNALLESVSRPLAKVGWFRVVLDEAQSIKNHRTQVAQACWGLRAKRRWCLSGTPIQNAVDDLYSYFRFLRYDPYSVYNSFCTMVKLPISKNPTSGYKKLQAVLKTIMLRRTKGTLLDGEPIIALPPKSVKLKKVEFSEEERDFYTRLEADSRAQFQAYADSGTVKQNYVNILLMLLRLRQACDHPFLVQGYDSSSILKPVITMAKKLTREQQIGLLNCLEGSLAICGICSDPPEDAVVSICGHVFCNQCISERLSGDDSQCPVLSCKDQLNVSLVFPKGTLKSCLSDNFSEDGSNNLSASESSDQGELVDPWPPSCFNSSKIKAALEVLQSLSKPQTSVPETVPLDSVTVDAATLNTSNSRSGGFNNENCVATKNLANTIFCVKEKAIVFSQWTRMLDLLEDRLKESSIVYRRLDGTMSVCARDKAVRDFNTLPEVTVMIMSLKAASLGLNMVAACHVLLLDLWWNPTTEDQAIDRAHRIGQTRPVTVVRLTVKDTVEDRILALQQKKRELVASAFGEDEKGTRQTRLTVDDLKYLFMA